MYDPEFLFDDSNQNNKNKWFFNKYFNDGDNSRYWTFKIALNLLRQRHVDPTIIETGCQRQKDDFGAGMSTSIFAEYVKTYGGRLLVCDNDKKHLKIARECVGDDYAPVEYHCSDSVVFLREYNGPTDLVYLDSYDYPIFEITDTMGPREEFNIHLETLKKMDHSEVRERFNELILPCQEHCVNEYKAIKDKMDDKSILLIDDNRLPGGGKPGLLKHQLFSDGWVCLMDYQQSIWIRNV